MIGLAVGRTSPWKTHALTPIEPYVVWASVKPYSMSARSVCSGTRPSLYHSRRHISAPPRRPLDATLMPLAPNFIAVCVAFFMARRNAMRRSSCVAMFSATSCALVSALRTSMMLRKTSFSVSAWTSFFRVSTPAPRLPMTMPGRAVWMLIFALFAARSISMNETPAWLSFFLMKPFSLRSSCSHLA